MADHLRKQIRDAAAVALTGLATSGARVYENRNYRMQATNLPGLRIYTNNGQSRIHSMGVTRVRERILQLVVECCAKSATGMDDTLDAMAKEVEQALDANNSIGGAKYVEPRSEEVDMSAEADQEIGVLRLTFDVLYYTAKGAPDVAI